MAPQSDRSRIVAAVLVGICIGRMSMSLPLESHLMASNIDNDLIEAAWVASLSAPPLLLVEIIVRYTSILH